MNEMSFFNPKFLNLCDAQLQSEDGNIFKVHRIMLAMKSEYFCSMFCGMNEDRKQFKIPGISGNCLREILKYLYNDQRFDTEQQTFTSDQLLELFTAADYLCLQDLCLQIKQHWKKTANNVTITVHNCLTVLSESYKFQDESIIGKSFRFVETKFQEILRTQMNNLAELCLEILEKILGSRSLNVTSERFVWESIVEWTQNNIESRSECVPRLLMCLARKELDENLAQEILQHQIVSGNTFMKKLNELKYYFSSNLDPLLHFLENYPNSTKQPLYYRCPPRLHIICCRNGNIFITYDEKIDLWRRIPATTGLKTRVRYSTIVIGRHFYLFNLFASECKKFDIIAEQWMPMSPFPKEIDIDNIDGCLPVVEVDGHIYIIHNIADPIGVNMLQYDTLNDRWFNLGSLNLASVFYKAVTLNRKIYLIGDDSEDISVRMFDTVTKRLEVLPKFKFPFWNYDINLVPHHEKVYIIGGYNKNASPRKYVPNVEVFDPETNLCNEIHPVPTVKGAHVRYLVSANVLNEQIVIYEKTKTDHSDDFQAVLHSWTELENKWKEVHESNRLLHILEKGFSTVTDEETIRSVMKVNREPGIGWQTD